MDMRMLGNTGIEVSAVGLGTWAIGGGPWWGDSDDDESVRAIHATLDAGVNLVDTAPVYAYGHSEEIVGRAIAGRRDKVVLATKAGLWWRDKRGEMFFVQGGTMVRRSLRPETIEIEIEDSLRRLRTDYIDLYQTHWQAPEEDPVPVEDTMACLMRLKDQGKIRAPTPPPPSWTNTWPPVRWPRCRSATASSTAGSTRKPCRNAASTTWPSWPIRPWSRASSPGPWT